MLEKLKQFFKSKTDLVDIDVNQVQQDGMRTKYIITCSTNSNVVLQRTFNSKPTNKQLAQMLNELHRNY